jgi:voltage-gated potassium channel
MTRGTSATEAEEGGGTPRRGLLLYEAFLALLALLSLFLAVGEERGVLSPRLSARLYGIDCLVWAVFAGDYAWRFHRAEDKRSFILHNWIELLAIIPFHPLAKGLRGLRFLRVLPPAALPRLFSILRLTAYFGRAYRRLRGFLTTNHFHLVLAATVLLVLFGAAAIRYFEESMGLGDALLWSFVTTTTVGYGDLAPRTTGGRIVASLLMVVGIGFLSMLTGAVATYFLRAPAAAPDPLRPGGPRRGTANPHVRAALERLERFEELSPGEVREVCRVLEALKAPGGTDRGEAAGKPDGETEGPASGRGGTPRPDASGPPGTPSGGTETWV